MIPSRDLLEVLRDLEEYLDDRADINAAGGPDKAMRLLMDVREQLAVLRREQ